jgi:hypothetical protein
VTNQISAAAAIGVKHFVQEAMISASLPQISNTRLSQEWFFASGNAGYALVGAMRANPGIET